MGNKKIKAIQLIQRRLRGLMSRTSLEILKSASERIKATLLSCIMRKKYKILKRSVKLIEVTNNKKFFLKYLLAKLELRKKYLSFYESEIKTVEFKSKFEQNILFPPFIELNIEESSQANPLTDVFFKPKHHISFNDIFRLILEKASSKVELFTIVLDFHQLVKIISLKYHIYILFIGQMNGRIILFIQLIKTNSLFS